MTTTTYLAPIDKPKSPVMKCVYLLSKRQLGFVATPISVFGARMPIAFGALYGKVARLDKRLRLPRELSMLVREQVASINACEFCMDVSRWYAFRASDELEAKFDALGDYPTSPLFTDAERAALDFVTELTQRKHVEPPTFARLREHFDEREACEIVWLVASEHLYNLSNIALNIGSDGLCELSRIDPPSGRPDAGPHGGDAA